MRLEFLPADAAGLSDLARAAASGQLALPGLTIARAAAEVPPRPSSAPAVEDRAHLARWLESRLADQRPHVAALESVRSLADPETACVLATVSPGALGGTFSELWKVVAAIGVARALDEPGRRRVVPLVWIEGDGPLRELARPAWLPNHHADLQRVGLANLPAAAHPAAEVVFDENRQRLPALRALLGQLYGDHAYVSEALELFTPRAGETFTSTCARGLAGLFSQHGLVWLEPAWLREELSQALAEIVGHDPSAVAPDGEPLALRAEGGRLRQLRACAEGFRFDDEPGSRTAAELAAEIVQEPSAWSAGPALLALVQERVLPVRARVGDAEELELETRLLPLRARSSAPAPAFVLRSPVTVVDAECTRAFERLGLTPLEVLRARGVPGEKEPIHDETDEAIARLRTVTDAAVAELLGCRASLARLDPAFSTQVKRAADRLRGAIEGLTGKVEHARANRRGTRQRHARRLASFLAPHGELQERVLSPFPFVARHGRTWLDELVEAQEPFASEHLVVHLSHSERD